MAAEDVLIEGAEGIGGVWREVVCRLKEDNQVDTVGLYDRMYSPALASWVFIAYFGPSETSSLKQAAILSIFVNS